ncbi:unnamed protein product [Blepharisma stoltei]|uniref:Uncharacterized protein n=1 Tax=Blepharisma stoltei TaxID=1481888 RepID=A0AAU9IRC3_9CILI|nr:unnamed protein product [Blepharisma stoltei]
MKKENRYSLDFLTRKSKLRSNSRSRQLDSQNPVFSVVSSCVGSPRRFIEDYSNFNFDYQSYLTLCNNKTISPSPQVSDRKSGIPKMLQTSFHKKNSRGASTSALHQPMGNDDFLKTFHNNKGKLDKWIKSTYKNMIIKKEAEEIRRKVQRLKTELASSSKIKYDRLPTQESKNCTNIYYERSPSPLKKNFSSQKIKCDLHRQNFQPKIPNNSKSKISLSHLRKYFLIEPKKPFRF